MKREKRTAVIGAVLSFGFLALIVLMGNVLGTVFAATPFTFIYWLLWFSFAAATFLFSHSLGKVWRNVTHQKVSPIVATISVWATGLLVCLNAILWAAHNGSEGDWSLIAESGLLISGITAAISGIIGLATLPKAPIVKAR